MSRPVVSIVTAAYNAATSIAETIRSVQAQTVSDWEMIIVDDGSSDETVQVSRSFDDRRIRVIQNPHSGLPAVARNRGIEEARAPYIAFIDADDMWRPAFLEKELAALNENGVTLVHCAWDLLEDGVTRPEPPRSPEPVLGPPRLLPELVRQNFVSCCAVTVHREALLKVGMFDPDPGLRGPEDFDLWLRLAPHSVFRQIPEPLLIVRVRRDSLTANLRGRVSGDILALRKLKRREPALVAGFRELYRKRLAYLLLELGTYELLSGQARDGRSRIAEAMGNDPFNARAWFWLGLALGGSRLARAWLRLRNR